MNIALTNDIAEHAFVYTDLVINQGAAGKLENV